MPSPSENVEEDVALAHFGGAHVFQPCQHISRGMRKLGVHSELHNITCYGNQSARDITEICDGNVVMNDNK